MNDLLAPGVEIKFHAGREGNRQLVCFNRENGRLDGMLTVWDISAVSSAYSRGEISSYYLSCPELAHPAMDISGHWAIVKDLYCISFTEGLDELWFPEVYENDGSYRFNPVAPPATTGNPGSRLEQNEVTRS
ncbi:hypothetical protein [Xylophilus sp. GOD-11R]|uniref:hypothetical protein n=1 Tax=Xylophilus sp. GOD-11R TaxID=3089814 RepID=UPI00298C6FD7|nr:hypothetical protein [Xylophilus sp. GOD-11R]WPB57136.1 hypothetical protein R9X41_00275 [Xylophilus sp. GOD-11R]